MFQINRDLSYCSSLLCDYRTNRFTDFSPLSPVTSEDPDVQVFGVEVWFGSSVVPLQTHGDFGGLCFSSAGLQQDLKPFNLQICEVYSVDGVRTASGKPRGASEF